MMTEKLSRRSFLKITGVTALAAGLGYRLQRRMIESGRLVITEASAYKMGTLIKIQLAAENRQQGQQDLQEIFRSLDGMIFNLDHRQEGSPLWRLNQDGILAEPPADLLDVLQLSKRLGKITSGALDVTIKPAFDHYRRHLNVPQGVLHLVNYQNLILKQSLISFREKEMAVTLDGIAKGWVVDQTVSILVELGYQNTLVEAGGDMYLSGSGASKQPWTIGLRHPQSPEDHILRGQDLGLATSGADLQAFSEDQRHHHILDPTQGASPQVLASATVSAPSAALADGLSTAVMVLGPDKGLQLVEQLDGVEALLVSKQGQAFVSQGFQT